MAKIYLNEDWRFTEHFSETLLQADFDENALETIRLPHTCKELPYNYFDEEMYQMVSGYRRILSVPEDWQNKAVLFTCEGAAHESTLFVNGTEVMTHSCGYTGFTVDISEYLHFGKENVLVLRVDSRESLNVPPFGFVIDYMTFGGVYREIYLEVKEKHHIRDVFAKTDIKGKDEAVLTCEITLSDSEETKENPRKVVRAFLKQKDTDRCPLETEKPYAEEVCIGEIPLSGNSLILEKELKDILFWDTEHPYLYELKVELTEGERVTDSFLVTVGFRTVAFRADGFYLNGQKFKIRGLNRHQSFPYVGYAMPESMQKQDADILKFELGCNAVRNSHYPQSHHFVNRCDEIGLLVFTEFPGWQHIGDEVWKKQACINAKDMICQYRNHPSIFIWGIRINESQDDDAFYTETNRIAHELDATRPTGGVRNFKNSHLLEDVYTYNDFVHDGTKPGCEPKKNITSDMQKGYLITEYNGHMYPTKPFDWEEHRIWHAIRHARVLNDVAKQNDIAGSFGWCMFDYNTHKDFGSGDRICYHGVTDMFRNPKPAASVYASQQEKSIVLDISSSMDIGEHPATNLGSVYIFSNADSVKMYKNDHFIKEYRSKDSEFDGMAHGPILIDDFVGNMLETEEGFSKKKSELFAGAMNYVAIHGYQKFPPHIIFAMIKALVQYKMKPIELVNLYTKYVGNWGETATVYRFEAIKDGKVVKTVTKQPMRKPHLETKVSHTVLQEGNTYDVAQIRIRAVDENDNVLPYFQEPIRVETEGPVDVIGGDLLSLKGGMGGLYIKTTGETGNAKVRISHPQTGCVSVDFVIEKRELCKE